MKWVSLTLPACRKWLSASHYLLNKCTMSLSYHASIHPLRTAGTQTLATANTAWHNSQTKQYQGANKPSCRSLQIRTVHPLHKPASHKRKVFLVCLPMSQISNSGVCSTNRVRVPHVNRLDFNPFVQFAFLSVTL